MNHVYIDVSLLSLLYYQTHKQNTATDHNRSPTFSLCNASQLRRGRKGTWMPRYIRDQSS